MFKQLPRKPHIDSLKKQARQLLKAHQSAQPDAATRIKAHFPRLSTASESAILEAEFSYQDAQYALAREYGFDDWSKLVMTVEILRQVDAAGCPYPDSELWNPTLITFPFYSPDSRGISCPEGKVIYLRFLASN